MCYNATSSIKKRIKKDKPINIKGDFMKIAGRKRMAVMCSAITITIFAGLLFMVTSHYSAIYDRVLEIGPPSFSTAMLSAAVTALLFAGVPWLIYWAATRRKKQSAGDYYLSHACLKRR